MLSNRINSPVHGQLALIITNEREYDEQIRKLTDEFGNSRDYIYTKEYFQRVYYFGIYIYSNSKHCIHAPVTGRITDIETVEGVFTVPSIFQSKQKEEGRVIITFQSDDGILVKIYVYVGKEAWTVDKIRLNKGIEVYSHVTIGDPIGEIRVNSWTDVFVEKASIKDGFWVNQQWTEFRRDPMMVDPENVNEYALAFYTNTSNNDGNKGTLAVLITVPHYVEKCELSKGRICDTAAVRAAESFRRILGKRGRLVDILYADQKRSLGDYNRITTRHTEWRKKITNMIETKSFRWNFDVHSFRSYAEHFRDEKDEPYEFVILDSYWDSTGLLDSFSEKLEIFLSGQTLKAKLIYGAKTTKEQPEKGNDIMEQIRFEGRLFSILFEFREDLSNDRIEQICNWIIEFCENNLFKR